MSHQLPTHGLELRSLVKDEGILELSLHEVPVPTPGPHEVLIAVEAAPINPSDLGLLLPAVDVSSASFSGTSNRPVVSFPLDKRTMRALAGRVNQSLTVGNEGAGVVVATGSESEAQALLGKTVALAGGGMYAQYRCVPAANCLVLPEGTSSKNGAASFVNPLTALGMVATLRREGHHALVHTAAASNLGQMLIRLCREEAVPLVNVVRSPDQVRLLTSLGATHVCDSSAETFMDDLIGAITDTHATLAFDAVGGGTLASQILSAMEVAASATNAQYSRYGSTTHKQLYIYGGLDTSPTVLSRSFGFAWGVGGWLLTPFLQSIGSEELSQLHRRVADGLTSTFKSNFTKEISLAEILEPTSLAGYAKRATGEKYLVVPSR